MIVTWCFRLGFELMIYLLLCCIAWGFVVWELLVVGWVCRFGVWFYDCVLVVRFGFWFG